MIKSKTNQLETGEMVDNPFDVIEAYSETDFRWTNERYYNSHLNGERLRLAKEYDVPAIFFSDELLTDRSTQIAGVLLAMREIGLDQGEGQPLSEHAIPSDQNTLHLEVLNGGRPFTERTLKAAREADPNFHPVVRSVTYSRYGGDLEADDSKEKELVLDTNTAERLQSAKHLVLWEDVVDESHTIREVVAELRRLGYQGEIDLVTGTLKEGQNNQDGYEDLFRKILIGTVTPLVFLCGEGMNDPPNEVHRFTPAHMISRFQKDTEEDIDVYLRTMKALGGAANPKFRITLIDPTTKEETATVYINDDWEFVKEPIAA